MSNPGRSRWPLMIALALLGTIVIALIALSNARSGEWVYALDDAYIHMAIARNLVDHGIWGVTPEGFSSSASSLLWPLLLAAFYGTLRRGLLWAPLILNVIAAVGTLILVDRAFRSAGNVVRLATQVALILLIPMAAMIASGMEHQLHVLLTLAFVLVSSETIARNAPTLTWRERGAWYGLAVLLAMTRYEALFTIVAVCALLLVRRRWLRALTLGLVALTPATVYGVIATRAGWSFLPHSLLLKAPVFGARRVINLLGLQAVAAFERSGLMLLLLFLCAVLLVAVARKARDAFSPLVVTGVICVVSMLLHANFADLGWFFRYEAYLVALAIVFVGLAATELGAWSALRAPGGEWMRNPVVQAAVVIAALFCASPLILRAARGVIHPPRAMHDRYLEHILPARFVRSHYNDATISCNDIGALAYYTQARLLDVYGLARLEPLVLRRKPGGYTRDDVFEWTKSRGSQIAILQSDWQEIAERIPAQWIQVGEWRIPPNVVFLDSTIAFYATDPAEARDLAARLEAFSKQLPSEIRHRSTERDRAR